MYEQLVLHPTYFRVVFFKVIVSFSPWYAASINLQRGLVIIATILKTLS